MKSSTLTEKSFLIPELCHKFNISVSSWFPPYPRQISIFLSHQPPPTSEHPLSRWSPGDQLHQKVTALFMRPNSQHIKWFRHKEKRVWVKNQTWYFPEVEPESSWNLPAFLNQWGSKTPTQDFVIVWSGSNEQSNRCEGSLRLFASRRGLLYCPGFWICVSTCMIPKWIQTHCQF